MELARFPNTGAESCHLALRSAQLGGRAKGESQDVPVSSRADADLLWNRQPGSVKWGAPPKQPLSVLLQLIYHFEGELNQIVHVFLW